MPATLIDIDSGTGLDHEPSPTPTAASAGPRISIITHRGFKREPLRDMNFDQMFVLVQDLHLSKNVKRFVQRLHFLCARRHGISPHDSFVPLKNEGRIIVRRIMRVNTRIFVAAYVIAFHPARVFGDQLLHIHAPLMEAVMHLLISCISPSLTDSFNSILFRYFAYFEIWKNPDQNLCLSELQCDLLDLYLHRVACGSPPRAAAKSKSRGSSPPPPVAKSKSRGSSPPRARQPRNRRRRTRARTAARRRRRRSRPHRRRRPRRQAERPKMRRRHI